MAALDLPGTLDPDGWKQYGNIHPNLYWAVRWPDGLGGDSAGAVRQQADGMWQIWDPEVVGTFESHWVDAPHVTTVEEAKAYAQVLWRMGGGT